MALNLSEIQKKGQVRGHIEEHGLIWETLRDGNHKVMSCSQHFSLVILYVQKLLPSSLTTHPLHHMCRPFIELRNQSNKSKHVVEVLYSLSPNSNTQSKQRANLVLGYTQYEVVYFLLLPLHLGIVPTQKWFPT